ncbi:MAG: hypothetical protein GX975_02885, partial [Clostridiales bacterium]|nr:hypothetical protein [Clostridiales bacterium]
SIAPGALYVFDTGSHFTFGLGKNDTVTLRNPEGLITDEYSWSGGHPAGTWSRVPDGTGNFIDYPNSKGVLNKVTDNAIVINEIESNGSDRDWVEIYNNSENAVNITGWYIKDDSDDHSSVKLPEGTILAPGGYFVFEADLEGDVKHFNFGLGSSDKVRLYDANGGLMDEHSWTAHATYGLSRIPNGTGGFKDVPLTKGSENIDADIQEEELVELDTRPWPGPASIQIIDETQMFKEDSSGLDYHGGALWLVDNGTATIWKLLLNNSGIPSFAPGFEDGKRVIFKKDADNPNAAGPDAEGITLDNRGMVYIASERDNSAKGTNYNIILQADPNQDAQKLVALREWNVTELIDNARQARGMEYYQVKSNMGIEAIEWIPNSVLNGKLFDTSKNAPYKSSDYSSMNDGLFFVGVEDDGYIYVFALAEDETPTLVSQIDTKLRMLMGLNYDELTDEIWAHADNGRGNVAARIKLNGTENPSMQYHNPPAELDPTKNNEGFAIANVNVNGMRPVYWVEDGITLKSLKMGFTNTYSFSTQEPDDDDDDDIAPAPSATIPANDGAVSVDYSDNNGSVSLEMPDKKVEEMIEKNAGTEVSIDASAVKNASAAEMPRKALADIAKAEKGMEVKLASGSITINKEAAASIAEQAKGESLSVEISPVKPEELSSTQKASVKTEDIVVDINIISGERKISSFKGELEIKIPYDGPQPVAVWYLNDAGQLERLECKFENGVVTFKLNHLSVYVLGQDLARATIWKNPFSDVKDKDWFYASIKFVNERKLMNGVGNNRFNPGGHATRGMIATIIHLMEGRPEPKSSKSFSDVADGKYYDKAVAWAAESKILGGYGNGKFGPDDYITREQLASILNNYAKYKGYDTSAGAEPGKFIDEDQISPWALKSVKTMQKAGIMTGNEKAQFLAGSKLTRAEAAAAITKFIQLLVK